MLPYLQMMELQREFILANVISCHHLLYHFCARTQRKRVHCCLLICLQVAWKLEETRKYYDMYNTLDTTLNFLQKEVKLLNSISENFHEAMKSTHSKGEFSKQFETIVHGVEVPYMLHIACSILFISCMYGSTVVVEGENR